VGCGPQDEKFEVKTDGSHHPTPTPEGGKALIYFVADGHLTTVFGFDEKWEGAVDGGRYFFVPIEPGDTPYLRNAAILHDKKSSHHAT
jgi:hypothetical protein